TGQVPFHTSSTDPALFWAEMRRLHETEPIPSLASFGVSPELEAVIRKATAKRLEDRYSTAEEMLAGLGGGYATASILLFTSPGSAEVFIDNIQRGISDEERGKLLVEALTPGLHSVRVSRAGYEPYKIDMVLEADRRTDLQVQLPARSTVEMPRFDEARQPHPATNKIAGGDDIKTAMLVFESLPVGSSIAFGGGQRVLAGEDGRATVELAPGTHEFEVTDPSGARKRKTVTITDQECGSFRTVAVAPIQAHTAAGSGPAQADAFYTAAARAASPVAAAARPSTSKKVAAVVSVIIFAALSAAAFIVIRGPGKAPQQQQAATDPPANSLVSSTGFQAPSPQATINAITVNPTPAPAPTPTAAPSVNKNSVAPRDENRKETQQPGARPIEGETPKPERNPHDNSPVSMPMPTPHPTPVATRPLEEPDTEFGTCLIVIVTGPGGALISGARVA